jgi:biopolymer transport protein TolQ
MLVDQSLWVYFSGAGIVVKGVMMVLLAASFLSWGFIFQRGIFLKATKVRLKLFEDRFWHTKDLTHFYDSLMKSHVPSQGLAKIFKSGFKEFLSFEHKQDIEHEAKLDAVSRVMRVACRKEIEKLERHLPFLASVGSVSPYIGLFGTVWGIMTAFHALSNVQQASISMVAPGISEALVATAMGLFAAIPAVLAYNRYSVEAENIINQYEVFQDEFRSLLLRNGVS